MSRLAFSFLFLFITSPAHADEAAIRFDPHPGASVSLEGTLRDESGRTVGLKSFFGTKPVVLVLGYLGCRNLCSTVTDGVGEALLGTRLRADADYAALFVSIDPRDEKAHPKERPGWHVLTGASAAGGLAKTVGFNFAYEADTGEFAHPAGFVILTPEGRVSRYFTGVRFEPAKVREALLAAGAGETPGLLDRLALVCFHDPVSGKYGPAILSILKIMMGLFAAGVGVLIWRRR